MDTSLALRDYLGAHTAISGPKTSEMKRREVLARTIEGQHTPKPLRGFLT